MSRRRKIWIVLGTVLAAAILIPFIHHYQLRAAVNAYIAELKARGEPMDLAQVLPPPVTSEQNSAEVFRHADDLFNESFHADKSLLETNFVYGMRMVAPGKAMIRWQQADIRDIDGTNSWENVTAAVVQNAKAFALLQQIVETPTFDFQIKYDRGVTDLVFTNLYLTQTKRSALRLETAGLSALHQGNTSSAVKNLRAILALVKALRDERLVISELVRMAITQIALTVNWEIMQSPNLTDEQLIELQRDWIDLEFVQTEENALAMERTIGEITLAKWRSSNFELQHYFSLGKEASESMGLPSNEETVLTKAKTTAKIFLWRYWWSYPDEMRCLKGYEALLEAPRFARTNYSFQIPLLRQRAQLQTLGIDKLDDEFMGLFNPEKMDMHSMLSQSVLSLSKVFDKVLKVEAGKQLTITAIALKRYQLKHGSYPANLNLLVPEFLPAVPLDPTNGKPMRYHLSSDETFLLYSIGADGLDDGGDPNVANPNTQLPYWQYGRDWVWPQPASAEEIQAYYARPAKN